jgi:hypothetical protein
MIEMGYGYPAIYSPVINWTSKMDNCGYSINEILSQLDNIVKLTGLDRRECENHIRGYLNEFSFLRKRESWCDGWTQDKWDQYNRHMKLQSIISTDN